jgi:hypothetical protein
VSPRHGSSATYGSRAVCVRRLHRQLRSRTHERVRPTRAVPRARALSRCRTMTSRMASRFIHCADLELGAPERCPDRRTLTSRIRCARLSGGGDRSRYLPPPRPPSGSVHDGFEPVEDLLPARFRHSSEGSSDALLAIPRPRPGRTLGRTYNGILATQPESRARSRRINPWVRRWVRT